MIIKCSQRGCGRELALHLTSDENDHVELGEPKGFLSQSPLGAFQEIETVAKGTQAKQPFFHATFNPPEGEQVTYEQFHDALTRLEHKLGLTGQARYPIYHSKKGRRHMHCVWSRIDIDKMVAINLPFFKDKAMQLSKELYLENGWEMPKGFIDKKNTDSLDISLGQRLRLEKQKIEPEEVRAICRKAWDGAVDLGSFHKALELNGLYLARGDKRSYVLLDHMENIYSLSRISGLRKKELMQKLGNADLLPDVADVTLRISNIFNQESDPEIKLLNVKHAKEQALIEDQKAHMVDVQRAERRELIEQQRIKLGLVKASARAKYENSLRSTFNKTTGRYQKVVFHKEIKSHKERQMRRREKQVSNHNKDRLTLHHEIRNLREQQRLERSQLAKWVGLMKVSKSDDDFSAFRKNYDRSVEGGNIIKNDTAAISKRISNKNRTFD